MHISISFAANRPQKKMFCGLGWPKIDRAPILVNSLPLANCTEMHACMHVTNATLSIKPECRVAVVDHSSLWSGEQQLILQRLGRGHIRQTSDQSNWQARPLFYRVTKYRR